MLLIPSGSTPKTKLNRRSAVPDHARRLAFVLEILVLLTLISSSIPLVLTSPIWWLRLGDAIVTMAPVLLLAVILLRFTSLFLISRDSQASSLRTQTVQLVTRWCVVFALLVPLQVIGFGWLWLDSGKQLSAQLSQATAELSGLRSRLNAASSEADLRRLLASTSPGLLPPPGPGDLPQQRNELGEALEMSHSRLQANLSSQRTATLVNSIPGTLRVLIGSSIIAAFLFTVRRHFH